MARFCVKCGSKLDSDARFCDECGAPVPVRTPARTAQPAAAVQRRAAPPDVDWHKVSLWSGIGLATLLVAGGVAAFLAMPPATPSASGLGEILNADKTKVADATCLGNFAYAKNPVIVGGFDFNTQRWMQVLSRAGIYGPPQPVTNGLAFGGGQQYSHTALGEKKIHDGKLCFADGLTVSTVQFTKPVKLDGQWHTQGSYSYAYHNADAWIQTPEAQLMEPGRFANLPRTAYVALVKGEHGWQFDNSVRPDTRFGLSNAMRDHMDSDASAGSNFLHKITGAISALFGARSGLVGKWRSDDATGESIEFTRDSAIVNGQATPVALEADHADTRRIYLVSAGLRLGTVELIDNDHLQISFGIGTAHFHRAD